MGFVFYKQKTAFELLISVSPSDVCSSDLTGSTVTTTASEAGSTSTGDTARFSLGAADSGVHGHLGGTMTDDPPSNGGYGDTQSLTQGKPMYTVEGNRV